MATVSRAQVDDQRPGGAGADPPAGEAARIGAALETVLPRLLGGDGRVEICDAISGNINCTYKVRYAGRFLGVRVALNQYRFKYEKGIVKEIFAIYLIYYARPQANDEVARGIVDGMLRAPSGAHIGHSLVRSIVHYDWSMTALPYPFFVYEWIEGQELWRAPSAELYFLAGQDLARLHRIGFDAYYKDIFNIGRRPLGWRESFAGALARELGHARPRLPAPIRARLDRLDVAAMRPPRPCLVHNDYAGGNILVEPSGARKIIDWDNWLVEAPELDLVKMKYWTAIGTDGLLAHDAALYGAFLDGYRSLGPAAVDEDVLRAYELLWLLRAFNFESARSEESEARPGGASWGAHYPPADAYLAYLGEA